MARYDIVVPVFGLASLHAYLSARDAARGRERWYFLAGILSGLSGLARLYDLFWLPVLLVLTMWDGRSSCPEEPRPKAHSVLGAPLGSGLRYARYVLVGFALSWLPYIAYVLGDLYDWRGQTRGYGDRFDLLNLQWYLDNLLREPGRYAAGLGSAAGLRVGFWSAVIVWPSSLGALAWRGLRHGDRAARVVVVPAIVIPLLFALLFHLKLINYLVTIAPLGAIAAAGGGVTWVRLTG